MFYVNRNKYTTPQIIAGAETEIAENKAIKPMANTGLNTTINDNLLSVEAKVKFFQEGNGDYYLSLLVVEDGVIEFQSNRAEDANHKKILRTSLSGGTFGQPIATGAIAEGTEFTITDEKTIDPNWNPANLEVAAIIWQKMDDAYEFVNAQSINVGFSTSVNFLAQKGVRLAINPTILQEVATITIDSPIALNNANIALFDLSGKKVKDVFRGSVSAGIQSFDLQKNSFSTRGIYFLKLEAEGGILHQKFMVN